jgi:hypothetical protein
MSAVKELATELVRRNVQCSWGCKPPYGFDACSTHQGAMHEIKKAIADAEARGYAAGIREAAAACERLDGEYVDARYETQQVIDDVIRCCANNVIALLQETK